MATRHTAWLGVVAVMAAIALTGCSEREQQPAVTPAPTPTPTADAPAAAANEDLDGQMTRAVRQNDVAAARRLLEADPMLVGVLGRRGETWLHHARSAEMAQLLIDHGVEPEMTDFDGNLPIRWAAEDVRPEVVQLLRRLGPTPDDVIFAVAAGDAQRVQQAIASSAKVLTTRVPEGDVFGSGWSLLHVATWCGQTEACRVLLDAGMDVNVKGGWGNTNPLEHAAYQGWADTAALLVERGVDIEDRDENMGRTALWWAAVTGRVQVVRVLLDAGATIDPELPGEIRKVLDKPYPGRDLPPREQYEQVLALVGSEQG